MVKTNEIPELVHEKLWLKYYLLIYYERKILLIGKKIQFIRQNNG
jgi:hypothetical protein